MDIPETLLRRLDVPGPRYTTIPTADRFVEAFGPVEYAQALRQRAEGAVVGGAPPLSIYVHIPFCESVCYYCACNKVITKHHERGREYLDALALEIDLHVNLIGRQKAVSQLHLGGGSPTFLSDEELDGLMQRLRRDFNLVAGAEISIEVDPRTATPDRLKRLAEMGFNRISFGIQDFDHDVQVAVHRVQSFESVRDLVQAARALNYESINADLLPSSYAMLRALHPAGCLYPPCCRAHPAGCSCGAVTGSPAGRRYPPAVRPVRAAFAPAQAVH